MSSENKELPLVSITMAAYNHEKYVQDAIQSIIDQDYPRIEFLVIDDGSKDSTWAKIEEMRPACEKRFERVVMYTRPNRGCAATGKELKPLRRGEFCGGIASDDRYLPGAISKLVRVLQDDPTVGVAVGTNTIMDAEGRRCYWDEKRNIVYDADKAAYRTFDEFITAYSGVDFSSEAFGTYAELAKNNHLANGRLARASFCDMINGNDEKAPLEDLWFCLQMAKVAKFKHIDEETFAYRWHGANTASQDGYMWRIGHLTYLRELQCLEKSPDSERWKDDFVSAHPAFETDVGGIWIGKHHRPHVIRVRTWKHVQYKLCVKNWQIPLTPVMKVI